MDQHGEFQLAKWNYSETMAFPMLGDHVIGMILLLSSQQHSYIITATDYFIKWVEVIPLREVDQKLVASFVREYIIHWFGIPKFIVTDKALYFSKAELKAFAN